MAAKKLFMIVDDDEDDRFFFQMAVKEIDEFHDCLEAKNGMDALHQLQTIIRLPDFIFLDLNMPKMGGREFLVELKKDKQFGNIPVIIYTTSNYQQDKALALKLGASHYITKPSNADNIIIQIRQAIKQVEDVAAL
ncbi:MAG: response regulator [Ferruginibacter sp.]